MARPRKHPRPLPDLVADRLRAEILNGELSAGTRLQQGAVAERFGVSPIPVREAFSQLEGEGFLGRDPYHGAFVRPLSDSELLDLTETRLALETLALRCALPYLEETGIQEAEAARTAMVDAEDPGAVYQAHLAMIDALYACAHRPHLLDSLKGIVARGQRYYPIYREAQQHLRGDLPSLKDYLQACARKDEAEAVRILETRFLATAEAGAELLRTRDHG